ncbi:MAG: amino acid adenylation domain-containing protein, partial [Candidatus Aminicenantes bacterium]
HSDCRGGSPCPPQDCVGSPLQPVSNSDKINQTEIAQVVIFIFEYALAALLMKWGITPHAMIGYSFGEYTAACVSGVISLEDGLKLVVSRGQLLRGTPEGAMLSVPLSQEEISAYLNPHLEVSLAIDNGPSCVITGSTGAIDAFEKQMKGKRFLCMRVPATRALHSPMMVPVLKEFERLFNTITLNKPQIPYISNVTGDWLTDKEAVSPAYWAAHLRETVQFARGMKVLLKEPNCIFLEVGPGRDISTLALRHIEDNKNHEHRVLNVVRPPHQDISDVYFLLSRIGRLWLYGQSIDWDGFYDEEKNQRNRIPLPTYWFERQHYWIEKEGIRISLKRPGETSPSHQKKDIADWFYLPSWKRFPIPAEQIGEMPTNSCWLVFIDGCGLGSQLVKQLENETQTVVTVKTGQAFLKKSHREFILNPQADNNYDTLVNELQRLDKIPDRIVHLWCVTPDNIEPMLPKTRLRGPKIDIKHAVSIQDPGFYSLLNIVRALGRSGINSNLQLAVVTNNLQEVIGKDGLYPGKATLLGPVKVIPTEYLNIKCRSIDVVFSPFPLGSGSSQERKLVKQLRDELISKSDESVIAYRGDYRWIQIYEPARFENCKRERLPLKQSSVWMITGGLGGIGLALAEYLVKTIGAKLVLTSRTELPPRDQWEQWLKDPGKNENVKTKIRNAKKLEKPGTEVLVFSADVSNLKQMQGVMTRIEKHFGSLDGVIHCAGLPDGEIIPRRTRETSEQIFKSKIQGTLVLHQLFHEMKHKPGVFILCSSVASIMPMFGQVGYCAANAFLDAFAHYRNTLDSDNHPMFTVSINWERWRGIGIANIQETQHKKLTGQDMKGGLTPEEGVETFGRILAARQPQVVVSKGDLGILLEQARAVNASTFMKGLQKDPVSMKVVPRPQLDSKYATPRNETEKTLANLWAHFFGYEKIGIRDDFFELGGDSLKALILLPKIHKHLQVEIPIIYFFDHPTIEKLSEYINGADKSTYFSIESAEKKEYHALSSAQKRLFILQQMAPTTTAYNESLVEVFDRNLAKAELEEIFRKLIKRHESLRTSFKLLAGESIQRIHDKVDFKIEYSSMEPGKTIAKDFIRPFDLSKAPLLRVGLMKLPHTPTALRGHPSPAAPTTLQGESARNRYLLMVDMHHIISDGISIDLIIRDFKAWYDDKELADLRIQYKDYVEWQNSKRVRERIMQQQGYWLKRFEGEIPVLNLPTDYPRPLEQSYEGKTRKFNISQEQTQQLKVLTAQAEATIFMKLVTIFYIFLFKISGQEDIVVGTPIAGRRHSDLENIIGMFVNTLALRNYPKPGKTFYDFLKEVKEKTLGDFEHQEYPFEQLIDKLNVNRDISRNPVFDVMFILHSMETREEIEKLYNYEKNGSRFDLTLQAFESGKNLFFRFEYCTKLFKEETIERFVGYFKNIISSIIDRPHQELWEIEIIPDVEKDRILYAFNNTTAEYPKEKTIHQLFTEQAEQTPDYIAVIGMDHGAWSMEKHLGSAPGSITYRELNKKTGHLAHGLREKGVKSDTIVAIMMERSIEVIVGILGILKAGGAYMPIAPDYPQERIDYMLKDSDVTILVKNSNNFRDHFVKEGIDVIYIDDPKVYSSLPKASKTCPKGTSSFGIWNLEFGISLRQGDQLAYIIYTSGSTGRPKGVMVDHVSIMNTLYALERMYPFTPADVYLMKTSYIFDVSLTELFGWFWGNNGGRLVLLEPVGEKEPEKILDAIEKMHVTHINFVPSMFDAFVDQLTPNNIGRLSGLKYIFLAGEALVPELVNKFQILNSSIPLENLYGPTEAAIYASRYPLVDWGGSSDIPIGKPIQNVKLYILDRHDGLQPVGVPGELVIGGIGVARGYLNNPELTAEKFLYVFHRSYMTYKTYISKKIYKTGDLARWLADGNIEFLGRIDYQVKIRGFRIELEEIENKIQSHHKIKKAVVVTTNKNGNKFLCAYYVSMDKNVNTVELKEYLAQFLPDYMIPVYFVPLEAIPMTPNGKVDRRELPEPEVEMVDDYIKPDTEMEKIIAEVWKGVLGLDKIGVHTRFFDIGGNSVNILQVHTKLKETIKVDVPLMVIFKYPTVYSLAGYLSSEGIGEDHIEFSQAGQLDLDKTMMKQTLQKLGTVMGQLVREEGINDQPIKSMESDIKEKG